MAGRQSSIQENNSKEIFTKEVSASLYTQAKGIKGPALTWIALALQGG